jgi:tetratricopeptide (TPR) repeat protein
MKRTAFILTMAIAVTLSLAILAAAQTTGQSSTPATGQAPTGQTSTPSAAAGTPAAPAAKRPPQAKTQPEFDAWKAAAANTDPAALEKAADDFATKFPNSELTVLLYKTALRNYQNANNAEKTEAMGRKVLALDPDDPEALEAVASVIAERTRDTDLDKDQRYSEAITMAQKATQTVDTDISVPAGTPQEKIDAYKAYVRSTAFSILGAIQYKKEDYPAAQDSLQKSIDAYPSDPDPVVVLRLALVLDKENKYPEALKWANKAVDMTKEGSAIGTPARHERDRLQALTGGAPPAQPQTPQTPPKN